MHRAKHPFLVPPPHTYSLSIYNVQRRHRTLLQSNEISGFNLIYYGAGTYEFTSFPLGKYRRAPHPTAYTNLPPSLVWYYVRVRVLSVSC